MIPFLITFTVIVSTCLFGSRANALHDCQSVFTRAEDKDYGVGPNRQTVRIVETRHQTNGESHFVLRPLLEESTWSSKFAPRGFDPQGDVSLVFDVLGYPLARVVGFSWNKRGDILAPTPETLNRRIAVFNRFLKKKKIEPILATFYMQPKPIVESFLKKWADEFGNPVASSDSSHTIHDIAYHYMGGILLPPPIAELLKAEATYATAWMRFNRNSRPQASWGSAFLIDSMSTSNNQYPETDIDEGHLSDYLGHYLGTNAAGIKTNFASYAKHTTPLDVFHRKILIADNVPFGSPDIQQELQLMKSHEIVPHHKSIFLNQMRREFPKLNKSLAAYGLTDFYTVQDMYSQRATTLRQAAEDFLKQTPTKRRR